MLLEYSILIAMWIFGLAGFLLLIPRKEWRRGMLALLVFRAIVWLCDIPAFYFDLLEAPVRLLPKASDLALTIEYIFYPVLFSLYYVKKTAARSKVFYFFAWATAITLFDIMLERYTDLLEYKLLPWYGMWMYILFLFYVSNKCCNWFFKDKTLSQGA